MNSIHLERDPLLAERFASHRWGSQIARELQRYTPATVFIDQTLPLKVHIYIFLI